MEKDEQDRAENWSSFLKRCEAVFIVEPDEIPTGCDWTQDTDLHQLFAAYVHCERPFATEIAQAVDAIAEHLNNDREDSIDLANYSKGAVYFLSIRQDVIHSFIMSLSVNLGLGTWATIIPFPEISCGTVAKWFLTDWWALWGVMAAALRQIEKLHNAQS